MTIWDWLNQAEMDPSDDNINQLLNACEGMGYHPDQSDELGILFHRFMPLAARMYHEKRFLLSYALNTQSMYFIDPASQLVWLQILFNAQRVSLDGKLPQAADVALAIKNALKELPPLPFLQSTIFLDMMFEFAKCFYFSYQESKNIQHQSTAIVFMKLVVNYSKATNYPSEQAAKLLSNRWKVESLQHFITKADKEAKKVNHPISIVQKIKPSVEIVEGALIHREMALRY